MSQPSVLLGDTSTHGGKVITAYGAWLVAAQTKETR